MSYRPFRFAAVCIACCFCLVLVLYVFADKPNESKNGFVRKLPVQTAVPVNSLKLKYPAYYIAGFTEHHLYLGNYSASSHLLTVSEHLADTQELRFTIAESEKYAWKSARIIVDSPGVFIAEGITPALYRGTLRDRGMKRFLPQSCFFNSLEAISENSFAARSIYIDSLGNKLQVLARIKTDSPYVQLAKDILTRQVDGIFCTDGTLDYDKQSKRFVYLYHYRNEFITLDSNLKILYTGRTVDTNTTAKITVADISKGDSKFSAPPKYVNSRARIGGNNIYVLSTLLADNEEKSTVAQNEIIDVFELANGKYRYTIYIPLMNEDRISDFVVSGDHLVAIHDQAIKTYLIGTN